MKGGERVKKNLEELEMREESTKTERGKKRLTGAVESLCLNK